jgi:hypothetical protein|tara:strand:- start:78 stop:995 length:918 start_codon:yes stop_codon:yes gene_type:complete
MKKAVIVFFILLVSCSPEQTTSDIVEETIEVSTTIKTTTTIGTATTSTFIGCSSLEEEYNEKSFSTVALAKPYSGQMISNNFTIQGCSSSYEGNVIWEIIEPIFGNIVSSSFTNGGTMDMGIFSFELDTTNFDDGKYYLRVMETDPSNGESSLKLNETFIPIYVNNVSNPDAVTEFGCSNLINTYNDISSQFNDWFNWSVDVIESPFPGEIISNTYKVKGCASAPVETILWELLDAYNNVIERGSEMVGPTGNMTNFSFQLDTTAYDNGRYFIKVFEPTDGSCCEGAGTESKVKPQTLIPIFIDN